jgi:hypothetical protein
VLNERRAPQWSLRAGCRVNRPNSCRHCSQLSLTEERHPQVIVGGVSLARRRGCRQLIGWGVTRTPDSMIPVESYAKDPRVPPDSPGLPWTLIHTRVCPRE